MTNTLSSAKYNLIYCGQDAHTLEVLLKSDLCHVMAVADIAEYKDVPAKNLADKLFKLIWYYKKKNSVLTRFFLYLYGIAKKWSSYSFKHSARLLRLICASDIQIIQVNDPSDMECFCQENSIDLLVVNNWSLLPETILDLPKYGTLNIHPSKLPQYRGSLPTLWSLKNHDTESALSFIKLVKGMDNGNIIAQIPFEILKTDDAITVEHKIEALIEQNMESVIEHYIKTGNTYSQNNEEVTFTEKYLPYMKVDWQTEKAKDIVNKINLYPYLWPFDFCYSEHDGNKKLFVKASLLEQLPPNISLSEIGKVIYVKKTGYAKTMDGYVTMHVIGR